MSKFLTPGAISSKGKAQLIYVVSDSAYMDYNAQQYFSGLVLDTDANLVARFYSIGSANAPHPSVEADKNGSFYGYGHSNWGTQNKFASDGTLIDGAFQGGYLLISIGNSVFVHTPLSSGYAQTHVLDLDGNYIGTTCFTYSSNNPIHEWHAGPNNKIYTRNTVGTTAMIDCFNVDGTFQWRYSFYYGYYNTYSFLIDPTNENIVLVYSTDNTNYYVKVLAASDRSTVYTASVNRYEQIQAIDSQFFYTRTTSTVYKRRISDGGLVWSISRSSNKVQVDKAGNVYVVSEGTTTNYTTRKNLFKYDPNGSLVWERDWLSYVYNGVNTYAHLKGIKIL